jgi:hypothetical protein
LARSDYAHWNEEQDIVWWLEEGRHGSEEPPYCDQCGCNHPGPCPDEDYDEGLWPEEEDEDEE